MEFLVLTLARSAGTVFFRTIVAGSAIVVQLLSFPMTTWICAGVSMTELPSMTLTVHRSHSGGHTHKTMPEKPNQHSTSSAWVTAFIDSSESPAMPRSTPARPPTPPRPACVAQPHDASICPSRSCEERGRIHYLCGSRPLPPHLSIFVFCVFPVISSYHTTLEPLPPLSFGSSRKRYVGVHRACLFVCLCRYGCLVGSSRGSVRFFRCGWVNVGVSGGRRCGMWRRVIVLFLLPWDPRTGLSSLIHSRHFGSFVL